jgi:hypothetical protein
VKAFGDVQVELAGVTALGQRIVASDRHQPPLRPRGRRPPASRPLASQPTSGRLRGADHPGVRLARENPADPTC